tara:strand:- start:811 stop:1341 length:531 start_codon:yes stop_codon:yes gene_type:complete
MNNIKDFPTTNYDSFFQRVYFSSIINNIISFGQLNNTNKTILDFGCGQKILSKKLNGVSVLNYDIKPEYSDYKTFKNLKFDIVIFNHVLMYFYPDEIEKLMDELKSISPKCKIIVGLGKQNLVSKIGKFITGNINAHNDTRSSYNTQIEILSRKTKINKIKKNIFFMTDIYLGEFQ